AAPLQQHGGDDDEALGDVLDLGRQVVEDEQVGDRGEHQHAEDRTDQRAAAAGEQRASDDDRGDRVQLVQVAVGAGAGGRPGHDHHRGDAAAQPRDHVEQGGVPADVDAGEAGRLGVAADGERSAAERAAVEHQPADHDDGGEDVDQQRDAEHVGGGDVVDRGHRDQLGAPVRQRLGQP